MRDFIFELQRFVFVTGITETNTETENHIFRHGGR